MFVLYLPINCSEAEIIACSDDEQKLRDIAAGMVQESRTKYKSMMDEAEQHHKDNERRAKNWIWLNRKCVKPPTTSWTAWHWTPYWQKERKIKDLLQYELSYLFYPGNENYLCTVVDTKKLMEYNTPVLQLDMYGMPPDFVDYSHSKFVVEKVKQI